MERVSPIRKITSEEMDKISKEETKKALKHLVKSQLELEYISDSSDEEDLQVTYNKLQDEVDKLNERYRMLEFKRMNMEIELTDERKLELNQASQLLTTQILALQGINPISLIGPDPLDAARI